jgi:hypothetical protein
MSSVLVSNIVFEAISVLLMPGCKIGFKVI